MGQRHYIWFLSLIVAVVMLAIPKPLWASDKPYSLSIRGNYTTSSKLFANPDAADEVVRNSYLELDDVFGIGIALRRDISESIQIGLSLEYLATKTKGLDRRIRIPTEDGYRLFSIELTGYFIIPISSQTVKIYIGGGGGFYFGDRIRRVAGVSTESISRPASFGIHVISGVDVFLNETFSVRGEMKFRDPQFETESKFANDTIEYEGRTYSVSTQPFKSKMNLDGIVFAIEMVLHFNL